MKTLQVSQADLMRKADWSKTSTSDICNGKTAYSRRIINEAANALNVEPFELLLPPERAMAYRGMKKSAFAIARSAPAEPPEAQTIVRTGTSD